MYSYAPNQIQSLTGAAFFLFLAGIAFWLVTLILALRNKGLNDISRFMWVFVVTMIPIVGGILYILMAPSTATPISLSEAGEIEGRKKMLGVYEKKEWQNR